MQLSLLPGVRDRESEKRHHFFETTERQLRPILERLVSRWDGGHWVEPCAGRGAIVRLCHEILPSIGLGVAVPCEWTVCELRDESASLEQLNAIVPVSIHCPRDFLRLTNECRRDDVELVITNLPWPEPGLSIVRMAMHLYPHADILGLCDVEPMMRDWAPNGEPRQQWLAKHMPDMYWLPGRGSGTQALRFAGQPSEYPHACAWMFWPRDGRDRQRGAHEVLTT